MKLDIARQLILNQCVKISPLEPFTYASGLKGPIYCDNRLILSHVNFRNTIIKSFIDVIETQKFDFDFIGGIATAGIPHAAFIADRLKLPMIYVRPKPKDHGRKNQIEGDYKIGDKVILLEDLVNQGASLSDAMKGVNDSGLKCSDCLCVVDYQMPEAIRRLNEWNLNLFSLTDFDNLIHAALELNLINESGEKMLRDWHAQPKGWAPS